ncbi:MAG: hypothetical protein LBH81_01480 [Rickettsiales bacterium]|nr:hypothetical protein [Rickettsiales bacterium]
MIKVRRMKAEGRRVDNYISPEKSRRNRVFEDRLFNAKENRRASRLTACEGGFPSKWTIWTENEKLRQGFFDCSYLIGFTPNTRRRLVRVFCRKYRHCAVVDLENMILIQIGIDGVRLVRIDAGGLGRLAAHGWVFVLAKPRRSPKGGGGAQFNILNCVGFAKRCLGIRNPFILTPLDLYRHLVKNMI